MYTHTAIGATLTQTILNLSTFGVLGEAKRMQFVFVFQLLTGHMAKVSPKSSRSAFSAPRTHVFTVPSGCFMRSAISLWDNPS